MGRFILQGAPAVALVASLAATDALAQKAPSVPQSLELPQATASVVSEPSSGNLVQLAILLDTSGSMKGLVDQARCQFWNVVDLLSRAERGGDVTALQIAVYQYGGSNARVRQILPFSEDLDAVSRALFSLRLEGGTEPCGEVLRAAATGLDWDTSKSTYRAIFIAGNEPFDQGRVTFGSVVPDLLSKGIRLNTIYCRWKDTLQGEAEQWEVAAKFGDGDYLVIDHNHHLPDVATPYDDRFRYLNERMNSTFVWFGKGGQRAMRNQLQQDRNAAAMSTQAFADRMSAKIGHLYKHVHHDLVDAAQHGNVDVAKMPVEKMPESLREMSPERRAAFINIKMREREAVRRQMTGVIAARHAWLVRKKMAQKIGERPAMWGDAFVDAVRNQAAAAGFTFDRPEIADASASNG